MKYEMAMSFLAFSFFFMMVMILQYAKPGPRRRNNLIFLSVIVFMNALMWELYHSNNNNEKDKESAIPWPFWILYATMLSYFIRFAFLAQ